MEYIKCKILLTLGEEDWRIWEENPKALSAYHVRRTAKREKDVLEAQFLN